MNSKPNRITESKIGIAALRIMASRPSGEATVHRIKKEMPNYVNLTSEDREQSETRPNEEMWEQQVRNLKSHAATEGNIFCEGFADTPRKGVYKITTAGRSHLRGMGY
ncbi:MAG: hypothetical protein C5B44_04600 [Acidobacteria bacterium]|nr:MAG: hypothetical protein C5B44_04600 [Acidobacteriota bacterium]